MDSVVIIMVFMYSRINGLSLVCWYNLNYYSPFKYYYVVPTRHANLIIINPSTLI